MTIESGMCGGSGALWYYSNTQWGENICSALWVFTSVFNCLPEGELQTVRQLELMEAGSWKSVASQLATQRKRRLETRGQWRSVLVSAGLGGELPIIQTFSMVFSDNL